MKKTTMPEGKCASQKKRKQIQRQHHPLMPHYIVGTCCLYCKKKSKKRKQAEQMNGTERSPQTQLINKKAGQDYDRRNSNPKLTKKRCCKLPLVKISWAVPKQQAAKAEIKCS